MEKFIRFDDVMLYPHCYEISIIKIKIMVHILKLRVSCHFPILEGSVGDFSS